MDKADRIILIRESIDRLKEDKSFLLEFPPLIGALPTLLRVGMSVANVASKVGPALARGGRVVKQAGNAMNKIKSFMGGGGGGDGGEGGGGGGSCGGGGGGGGSNQPQFDAGSAANEEESPDQPKAGKSGVEKQ